MQVVEVGFRIQIVSSVPERVHCADAVYIRQDGAVAPRRSRIASIAVACDFGTCFTVHRDNVSKEVFFEEIPVKHPFTVSILPVAHPDWASGFVVEVNQIVVAPFFRDNPPAVKGISVRDPIHRFGSTDTVGVVGEGKRFAARLPPPVTRRGGATLLILRISKDPRTLLQRSITLRRLL